MINVDLVLVCKSRKKEKFKIYICFPLDRLKTLTSSTPKLSELEQKLKKSDDEAKKYSSKVKELEDKIKKQDNQVISYKD